VISLPWATITLCRRKLSSLAHISGKKSKAFRSLAYKARKKLSCFRDKCFMTRRDIVQAHALQLPSAPSRARGSGQNVGRQRYAEIQAEDGEAVFLVARNEDRVQLHGAEIVSDHRERRDEEPAVVVSRTVESRQDAAEPPALAELELVSHSRELRPVAPRILVKTGLDESCAALVLVECVAQAEPDVDLVEALAVNTLPVGVVREAV